MVRLQDAEGHAVKLPVITGVTGLDTRFADVVVPIEDATAAGLDVSNLGQLELLLTGPGDLTIDDLRVE
jgi:hypothetical protein